MSRNRQVTPVRFELGLVSGPHPYRVSNNISRIFIQNILLTVCLHVGNWGRIIEVFPPSMSCSSSQDLTRGKMSFISFNVTRAPVCVLQEMSTVAITSEKTALHQVKMMWVYCCWYFFSAFVFCLLTDICYHAKQVFLCKRTCPVCVSPSSLLRTQMSSVIKNPVNFWKETDGYPTRT